MKKIRFRAFVFLMGCVAWSNGEDKYCDICPDHTMCLYSGVGDNCVEPGEFGVTDEEKKEILENINSHRRVVAKGMEEQGNPGPQPKAANLMKMYWDDDLAKVAQRWADQCLLRLDSCRRDPRFCAVGQTLVQIETESDGIRTDWTDILNKLYSGVENFPSDLVTSFSNSSDLLYVHLVWHETYAVGCGKRYWRGKELYVCNFGPGGSIEGKPVYAIGEPCSECPPKTVCEDGLCAWEIKKTDESEGSEAMEHYELDARRTRYCSLCPDHTMCKYSGIGEGCVESSDFGVSEEERKEIVEAHNTFRRKVAKGLETRGNPGPQPKAANLMKMYWDDELAEMAQRWADQCIVNYDDCNTDPRFGSVGQSFLGKTFGKTPSQTNWTGVIYSFYRGVLTFSSELVPSFRSESQLTYPQLVWHNTYAVGCGKRYWSGNRLYICNYGPAGNIDKKPVYAIGEPCSECPPGTICEDGLCDKGTGRGYCVGNL